MSTIERDELDAIIKKMAYVPVGLAQELFDDLKAKLAEVTRERDEARKYLADMDQASIKSSKDLAQAREQLEAVKAEAAAMRRVIEMITVHRRVSLYGAADAWRDNAEKALSGTAGRDVQEEVRRDKERIKELERDRQPTPEPVWQYRTTDRTMRPIWRTLGGHFIEVYYHTSKIWGPASEHSSWQACVDDPNTFPCDESGERIEDHSADAGRMVDEPLKVGDWVEMRSKPGDGCYETRTLQLSKLTWPRQITTIGDDGYVKPHGYDQWCNPQRFRRVPAPSSDAPLVAIARELREALAESSMSICRNGDMCDSLMVEAVDADRLLAMLEKLRDAEGGA